MLLVEPLRPFRRKGLPAGAWHLLPAVHNQDTGVLYLLLVVRNQDTEVLYLLPVVRNLDTGVLLVAGAAVVVVAVVASSHP